MSCVYREIRALSRPSPTLCFYRSWHLTNDRENFTLPADRLMSIPGIDCVGFMVFEVALAQGFPRQYISNNGLYSSVNVAV